MRFERGEHVVVTIPGLSASTIPHFTFPICTYHRPPFLLTRRAVAFGDLDPCFDPFALQELLAFYTVSQSAILIYLAVMTGLLSCLAWRISEEELAQRQAAESRLKSQNPRAFELRERMILEHGRPGSR